MRTKHNFYSHFRRQLYWPNWYKLWPSYTKLTDDFGPTLYTFCFGLLQFKWWGSRLP